jgi:hypothetical protein
VFPADRGTRRLLRHLQDGGQPGSVDVVLLRREDGAGRQAAHNRGGPEPRRQPALPQEDGRRVLPPRGPERLPGGDAGLGQVRRHLPDHQVRLHTHVRHRERHLHLHEPHLERDHLRDGTPRDHRGYNRGEQEGTGVVGVRRRGQHHQVRQPDPAQFGPGVEDSDEEQPCRGGRTLRQQVPGVVHQRTVRRSGEGGGERPQRHLEDAGHDTDVPTSAHSSGPEQSALAVLRDLARPRTTQQVRLTQFAGSLVLVDCLQVRIAGVVQACAAPRPQATPGEVAEGGQARVF